MNHIKHVITFSYRPISLHYMHLVALSHIAYIAYITYLLHVYSNELIIKCKKVCNGDGLPSGGVAK